MSEFMFGEIEPLEVLPLPFNQDDKIFFPIDQETGEIIGDPYSFNDFIQKINDISGINEELLGKRI